MRQDYALQVMAGSSMAAPVVAASAVLVRQYFMSGYYPSGAPNPSDARTPSGALMKAVIINSGTQLMGGMYVGVAVRWR